MNLRLHLAKPVIAVHLRERVRERSDVVRVNVVNVALRVSVWCGSVGAAPCTSGQALIVCGRAREENRGRIGKTQGLGTASRGRREHGEGRGRTAKTRAPGVEVRD